MNTEIEKKLISARSYPFYSYPFEYFNPVQSEVFSNRKTTNNMVVAANTSAGKTIAAELLMDFVLAQGGRVIYMSPLKALTEEKYGQWRKRFSGEAITILTGDYVLTEEAMARLRESRIIVMTSEMMDSRTRKFDAERNYWMNEVGLVVVDEAHILSTGRGDAVETGIMRFTRRCPQARIVLLSATMSNARELAGWLTSLNGKRTDIIESAWRPVHLQMHYIQYQDVPNNHGGTDYQATENRKIDLAAELVMGKPGEKFLVFVHSKKTGYRLKDKLRELGVDCAFHNADLSLKKRRRIEASFRDRENGVRVLISTSTTAWGINLPARNVVILGVHRGLNPVDELDIIQMAGRAGRCGIDDEGHVFLIVLWPQAGVWEQVFNNPRQVTSVLNERQKLAFHILAEIENRAVKTGDDLFAWYGRSLAFRQGVGSFTGSEARAVLDDLLRMRMIEEKADGFSVTRLGRVSAVMYYPPYDVYAWFCNFSCLHARQMSADTQLIAWAIAAVPSKKCDHLPQELQYLEMRWGGILRPLGRGLARESLVWAEAVCCFLSDTPPEESLIVSKVRAFVSDAERTLNTLKTIDRTCAFWKLDECWKRIEERLPRPEQPQSGRPAGNGANGAVQDAAARLKAAGFELVMTGKAIVPGKCGRCGRLSVISGEKKEAGERMSICFRCAETEKTAFSGKRHDVKPLLNNREGASHGLF